MAIISALERESGGKMASKFKASLGHTARQNGAGTEGRKKVRGRKGRKRKEKEEREKRGRRREREGRKINEKEHIQWQSMGLACTRPWVRSPVTPTRTSRAEQEKEKNRKLRLQKTIWINPAGLLSRFVLSFETWSLYVVLAVLHIIT